MMFGEADSESPRVPSPWTKARSSGSRSSNNSTPISAHKSTRASSSISKVEVEDEALSTPPTEEDEDEGGFFSLDVDFNLDRLNLGSKENHQPFPTVTATPASPIKDRPNRLAPEPDALGNLEYKLRLLPPTRHRYDRLLTQLKWRILQGGGFCTYEIGVLDDGRCIGICPTEMRVSLRVLASLASELGASVRVRRAFVLTEESRKDSESGQVSQLRFMSNVEATAKLLAEDAQGISVDGAKVCICKAGEEVLAWPEGKTLSKSFRTEGMDGSDAYEVDIEEARDEFIGGSWMGASDIDLCEEDGLEEGVDQLEAEEEQGFTFSLSLDEKATRQGVGFQRRSTTKRICRYQAKGAQLRRKKDASAIQASLSSSASTVNKQPPLSSHKTVSDGPVHSDVSQPCDESLATEGTTSNPPPTCERIIVEAVVSKLTEEETQEFIDYASL